MHVDLWRVGSIVLVAGLGFAGWNMLHDDADLEARATELACRGHVCNAVFRKKTRDLFGWTFSFTAYGEKTMAVDVTCTRGLWVLGDYRCDVSEIDHAGDGRFQTP